MGRVAEAQLAPTAWVTILGRDDEVAHRRQHALPQRAVFRISPDNGRKPVTPELGGRATCGDEVGLWMSYRRAERAARILR